MKQIRYLLISAAVMAFAACSSDVEEQGPRDFSGTKVVPEITIVDQGEAQFTKAYDGTGSTYFKSGDHVGFLLLDKNTRNLYSDTKEIGVLRYTFDGKYWGTYDSYSMTEDYCDVYCFYPYDEGEDHSYDGLWPNSYRTLDTSTNIDYLWGEAKLPAGSSGVNGMTPQVHMRMNHALARVSFRLKRKMAYDPNSNIGKGSVTAFSATCKDKATKAVQQGKTKYCFITGAVNGGITPISNPVPFNTLIGNSIPQAVGSTLGGRDEFMSVVPCKGSIDVNMTIDGQTYAVTVDQDKTGGEFKAGYHYLITLEYTGSEVTFTPGNGDGNGSTGSGSGMEIIPWAPGGNIGVKSISNN